MAIVTIPNKNKNVQISVKTIKRKKFSKVRTGPNEEVSNQNKTSLQFYHPEDFKATPYFNTQYRHASKSR